MDLVPAQAQPSMQQHPLRSADWDSIRAYLTLAPACRGLERPPTLEPEGPLATIKFNPHLFKTETLRPREGKQFV